MLRKFDQLARQSRFMGNTVEEFAVWREETKTSLQKLLGLAKMELCPPQSGPGLDHRTDRTGTPAYYLSEKQMADISARCRRLYDGRQRTAAEKLR